MKCSTALGIDIGGSHITAALVNLETGSIIEGSWNRTRINSQGETNVIIEAWSNVINQVFSLAPHGKKFIGIGMPGPFDYKEGICWMKGQHKYDALYNLNVKMLLADKLAIAPEQIRFVNDAGCFLQGEVFCGAVQQYKRVIGLTLGTGLGSASYYEGTAHDANYWCTPFKEGIAEDYLSTRWFVKRYHELAGESVPDVKALVARIPEDKRILLLFNEFAVNLANLLDNFVQSAQPEAIVIGGNIANAATYFFPVLKTELDKRGIATPFFAASLGETAAIIGAASLWAEYQEA